MILKFLFDRIVALVGLAMLEGDDRVILKLRPGITGPATLKYRLEDEMIADKVREIENGEFFLHNATKGYG